MKERTLESLQLGGINLLVHLNGNTILAAHTLVTHDPIKERITIHSRKPQKRFVQAPPKSYILRGEMRMCCRRHAIMSKDTLSTYLTNILCRILCDFSLFSEHSNLYIRGNGVQYMRMFYYMSLAGKNKSCYILELQKAFFLVGSKI